MKVDKDQRLNTEHSLEVQ